MLSVSYFEQLEFNVLNPLASGKSTTGPLAALQQFCRLVPLSLRSGPSPELRIAASIDTVRKLVILAAVELETFDPVEETGRINVGL